MTEQTHNNVDLVIEGGVVVGPGWVSETAVAIDEGKIVALGSRASNMRAERRVDARGKMVIPGGNRSTYPLRALLHGSYAGGDVG